MPTGNQKGIMNSRACRAARVIKGVDMSQSQLSVRASYGGERGSRLPTLIIDKFEAGVNGRSLTRVEWAAPYTIQSLLPGAIS